MRINSIPVSYTHLDVYKRQIYDCIAENKQISLDDLSEKLEIPPFKLLPILLDLELKSYIKALSGKQYSVI